MCGCRLLCSRRRRRGLRSRRRGTRRRCLGVGTARRGRRLRSPLALTVPVAVLVLCGGRRAALHRRRAENFTKWVGARMNRFLRSAFAQYLAAVPAYHCKCAANTSQYVLRCQYAVNCPVTTNATRRLPPLRKAPSLRVTSAATTPAEDAILIRLFRSACRTHSAPVKTARV